MRDETDDRPTYWLPWWWDHPESVPIDPADLGMPDLSPPDLTEPVAEPAATPPTASSLGGSLGGGPPPAAAAAVQLADEELREIKRLKKRKRR